MVMESLIDLTRGAAEERDETVMLAGEDHFKRLPDDLIVRHILDKISRAKWLCWCSLVSKHFSALVFQTHNVSCKLPLTALCMEEYPENPPTHSLNLPKDVSENFRLIHQLFHSEMGCSPSSMETMFSAQLTAIFLPKFMSLKSLHVEFDYSPRTLPPELPQEPAVVKWRFHPKSETFLLSRYLGPATGDGDNIIAYEDEELIDNILLMEYFFYYKADASSRYWLVEKLIPFWAKELENLVVTDSKKQGRLVLDQTELVRMRNSRGSVYDEQPKSLYLWSTGRIQLPLSGCVMKLATLYMLKCSDDKTDNYLIAKEAFEGEEPVYGEAAVKILEKLR